MEVLSSGRGDRLDVDGLDPLSVRDQFIDAEAVHDEPAQGSTDRAGRLESQGKDADQVVARGADLLLGDRLIAHPLELGQHLDDRGDRHLGVDRRPRRERPGAAAQVEAQHPPRRCSPSPREAACSAAN